MNNISLDFDKTKCPFCNKNYNINDIICKHNNCRVYIILDIINIVFTYTDNYDLLKYIYYVDLINKTSYLRKAYTNDILLKFDPAILMPLKDLEEKFDKLLLWM